MPHVPAAHEPLLPVVATTFNAKYLAPLIEQAGEAEAVSVQKTPFRKFNAFLQHMQEQGVLRVEERQHGVREIVAVDAGHQLLRGPGLGLGALGEQPKRVRVPVRRRATRPGR